jgi:hypothetical protein
MSALRVIARLLSSPLLWAAYILLYLRFFCTAADMNDTFREWAEREHIARH